MCKENEKFPLNYVQTDTVKPLIQISVSKSEQYKAAEQFIQNSGIVLMYRCFYKQ